MTPIARKIKDIQYATDLSIEKIADKIGFSRTHLMRLMREGSSKKALVALDEKFGNVLSKKQPPKDIINPPDDVSLQAILNLTESNRILAEAVAELSKKLNKK